MLMQAGKKAAAMEGSKKKYLEQGKRLLGFLLCRKVSG
jgi:hypothetical protein